MSRRPSSTSTSISHKDWKLDAKIYVGDLGYGAAKQELEDLFGKHGTLKNVWIARRPPGFAFVEFEDALDAEDATRALDGTKMNGRTVRVEMSSGKSRWGSGGPPKRRGDGGYNTYNSRPRRRSRSYSPVRRRSRSRSRSETPPRRRSRSRSRGRRD